ncbi:heteromeric transposase endonuclease subunit TnsA [Paraburkholderia terrae]|uniref:Heteromeric transposase endonuclease subunit TnsA n=2 Tax=Paraburkholderia terrae TaxID=311230 RepID=A0A2I8F243_9BURK|nr:heteromeric transposase endonuclease subunit TnsA [Paraburkholderia terrae]
MARGPKLMTEKLISRWVREGRGTGHGQTYKPWLEVFDFSSLGRVQRIYSAKYGRTLHLMSDVESHTFFALEWSRRVTDVREQFPLDRDSTLETADKLRIRHPHYPGTNVATVITVDFVVDVTDNDQHGFEAIDCKRTEDAENPRAIEKLQIAHACLAGMHIPHHLVFHSELPMQRIRNIEWMRGGLIKSGEKEEYPGAIRERSLIMAYELSHSARNMPLNEYCAGFEVRHGMRNGEGLRVAKLLLYERVLLCDLSNPNLACAPLRSFRCVRAADGHRANGAE